MPGETVEIDRVAPRVVERDIRDDADAALRGLGRQAHEVVVAAEVRIDVAVVGGIVLVVARCGEQRRHVKRVGAEIGDVIQLFDDAGDVAAEEIVAVDGIGTVAAARLVRLVGPLLVKLDRQVW